MAWTKLKLDADTETDEALVGSIEKRFLSSGGTLTHPSQKKPSLVVPLDRINLVMMDSLEDQVQQQEEQNIEGSPQ